MIRTKNTCRLKKSWNKDMAKHRKYPDLPNYLINFNTFQLDNICIIPQQMLRLCRASVSFSGKKKLEIPFNFKLPPQDIFSNQQPNTNADK